MKLLTIDNYKRLEKYTKEADLHVFNGNIVTLLMWSESYPYRFETYEHFALITCEYNHAQHWFMPFCKEEYYDKATEKLIEVSQRESIALEITCIESYRQFLESHYPNQILCQRLISSEDYIYDRTQQETLKGKAMQKRRNHFNAFKANVKDYRYKPIEKEDFPHILLCLKKWRETKETKPSLDYEEKGIHYLFMHYEELNILGGCIYIQDECKAFLLASQSNPDMVEILVEKADATIRGLYVAILKFFLATLPPEIHYINREEDMGNSALRKAKHDMHPICRPKKYNALFTKTTLGHPDAKDTSQLKDLWLASFEEENEVTTNFFFEHLYHPELAYVYKQQDTVLGMAYIHPWKMMLHQQIQDVYFILGVATHERYRHTGIMHKLLNQIQTDYEGKLLALQAYDWSLYEPFGFRMTHTKQRICLDVEKYRNEGELLLCNDASSLLYIYQQYTKNKDGYRLRDEAYYEDFYLPYHALYGSKTYSYEKLGYVTYTETNESIYIEECIYTDKDCLQTMLGILAKRHKEIIVDIDLQASLIGESKLINSLMMNQGEWKESNFIDECL